MTKNFQKNVLTLLLSLIFCSAAAGQTTVFCGAVLEETSGNSLIGANIIFYQDGVFRQGTSTDLDGLFCIFLDPGFYDVEISYIGVKTKKWEGIIVDHQQLGRQYFFLENQPVSLTSCGSYYYKIPLLELDETTSGIKIAEETIRRSGLKSSSGIIGTAPGISILF